MYKLFLCHPFNASKATGRCLGPSAYHMLSSGRCHVGLRASEDELHPSSCLCSSTQCSFPSSPFCMPLHQCIISVSLYPVVLSVYPKYHGCKHTLLCQVLSFMLLQSLSPHVTLGRLLCISVSPHENQVIMPTHGVGIHIKRNY